VRAGPGNPGSGGGGGGDMGERGPQQQRGPLGAERDVFRQAVLPLHPVRCTLYPKLETLDPGPYTLNPKP